MRIVINLLIGALFCSLLFNVILWRKYRGSRPILSVNGQGVSKNDMDMLLEMQSGPEIKARMTERILIEQESKRLNAVPPESEVEEEFRKRKQLDWELARKLAVTPWFEIEAKSQIREAMERDRLLTRDIVISDAEIDEEYQMHPGAYDAPNTAHAQMALVFDESKAADVKELLQQNVNPTVIMSQYPRAVTFLGENQRFTALEPFGTRTHSALFAMKTGSVQVLPPQENARLGAKAIVVRLLDIEPGHKSDPKEPAVRERIRRRLMAERARPWTEYLALLWANARFESEDPNDKRYISNLLFPEKAAAHKN